MSSKNKQTEANKRWQEKNREKSRYLRNRSAARSFLRKQATVDDLDEMENLIIERRTFLKENDNEVRSEEID